ncbi:MAG: hypothetical protein Q9221_008111 [Calogaya cf. arnoldii]
MDFATTQSSTCTSVSIISDLSNYWMPNLYFHKNGKFTLVPEYEPGGKHKIYYKYGHGGKADPGRSEFPKNFRMMAGKANLRSDDGSLGSGGSQLEWFCHGPQLVSKGMPKFTSCPYGLAVSMRFPSCWNGQDFNKDQPLAHMSYPGTQGGTEGCPAGFKAARFPEIFVEYWLNINQFDGQYGANDSPFVLSNGDPTGYGFHMDFLNGWKEGVLAKAMKTCDAGNTGYALNSPNCFGAGSIQEGPAKDACTKKSSVNEEIGLNGPLSQLPGCNPIQAGPGLATKPANCAGGAAVAPNPVSGPSPATTSTTAKLTPTTTSVKVPVVTQPTSLPSGTPTTSAKAGPTPPADTGSVPPSGGSSGMSPPSVNSTSGVWKAAGCFLDALNPRSLGERPEWWGQKISTSNCVEHCNSIRAKYAGTENGGQCFCGNQLINSASRPGKCTSKCVGDESEICGGPGTLSIYSLDGQVSIQKRRTHQRHSRHFFASV